jgi:hypothetical protein
VEIRYGGEVERLRVKGLGLGLGVESGTDWTGSTWIGFTSLRAFFHHLAFCNRPGTLSLASTRNPEQKTERVYGLWWSFRLGTVSLRSGSRISGLGSDSGDGSHLSLRLVLVVEEDGCTLHDLAASALSSKQCHVTIVNVVHHV